MSSETIVDHELPLEHLLPMRALVVTLRFTGSSQPAFFHQAALGAFLRHMAGSPEDFDQYIRYDACESGRVEYRPGDHYRFLLVGLAGGEGHITVILDKLRRLPRSAVRQGKEVPFNDNLVLVNLQDAFNEQSIESLHDACAYDAQTLLQEARLWRDQQMVQWHWISPVRLLKRKDARATLKGEARFCRDAADLSAGLLFERLHDGFADLLRRRGDADIRARGAVPFAHLDHVHLFWMDTLYADAKGATTPMGGAAGVFTLVPRPPLTLAWWRLLVLGQFLGVGQRTAFGWGRYRLMSAESGFTFRRPLPAASLLMFAAEEQNLSAAWRHVMSGADLPNDPDEAEVWPDQPWDDEEELEDAPEAPIDRMQADFDRMLKGEYTPPDMRGFLIDKPDGGVRPLAVSPVYDRVLQRAVAQVITPALDRLMYRHSHGFRRGHSRITASYDIQAAWRAGYRWVYESDIKDFL